MSDKGYLLSRLKSFGNALEGLKYILKTQQNARIHAVFTLVVFLLAYYLKLNRLEWVGLALVIAMVWIAEIFNTAVEVVIDMISPEHSQGARIVKDISAGAVLVSALFSVLVGILIFGPRLLVLITTLVG
jgi:diacylglycerol kinase (ATP)